MGKRGPLPKSNVVQLKRGMARSDRVRRAPRAVASAPSPPSYLKGEALSEWRRITPELERMGILSHLDRAILTAYCSSWSKYVALGRRLDTEGEVVAGHRGVARKNPAWQIYRDASTLCITLAKELGLSPASRSRLNTPEREADDSDLD